MSQVVTAPIDTRERSGQTINLPVEASTNLYTGTIGALNAAGNVTFGQDITGGLIAVGRVESDALNGSGVAGALSVNLKRSVFKFKNSTRSSAAYALGAADVGDICYVEDEQTVQKQAGSTYKVKAGTFLGIDPNDSGAWVDMRLPGSNVGSEDSIVDSTTGTAVAPVSGVVTIPAITSTGTAANAIATLIAEINKLKALIQ